MAATFSSEKPVNGKGGKDCQVSAISHISLKCTEGVDHEDHFSRVQSVRLGQFKSHYEEDKE